MKKRKEPLFYSENNEYYCVLEDKVGNKFVGIAKCHPDDKDLESEKVGYYIALCRAKIKFLYHIKNNELKPQLKILKQLYFAMNRSKHYNDKSYEAKMLKKHYYMIKEELDDIHNFIKETKKELRDYLLTKEKFRKQIRDKRNKAENK